MTIKDALVKRLQDHVDIANELKNDKDLISKYCPSTFGLTDFECGDGYDGEICKECWKMNFED